MELEIKKLEKELRDIKQNYLKMNKTYQFENKIEKENF